MNLGGRRDDFQLGLAMGDLHRAKGAKGPKESGFVVDNTMLGFDAVGFGWVQLGPLGPGSIGSLINTTGLDSLDRVYKVYRPLAKRGEQPHR